MRHATHVLRRLPQAAGQVSRGCAVVITSSAAFSHSSVVRNASLRTTPDASPMTPHTSSSALTGNLQEAYFRLLRQRLCDPIRPLPARNVYNELASRTRIVEEFHFARTSRRLARQRLALRFLRRYNVLLHGLLFYAPATRTWNTTAEFERLALFGESILVAEVRSRVLKLFPDISYELLVRSLPSMVGASGLSSAFDLYEMKDIVGAKPASKRVLKRMTVEQKCHMLCAVVGEMYWFVARTKPTDRTHNNALFPPSDVLIMHVLCSHLLECIPAEMIYRILEPVLEDIKSVWVNEPMSLPEQLRLTPRTIGAHSLNAVPLPRPTTARVDASQRRTEAQRQRRPLTACLQTVFVKSTMRPGCAHDIFDGPLYQILPTDLKMERCALQGETSAQSKKSSGVLAVDAANAERAMELARMALRA